MKLISVFKQLVLLLTFYLRPSKEAQALARGGGTTWSQCSKSCNGGVQWRGYNGTVQWRVCVSPPCPHSTTWADDLCARHSTGHQFGQWLSFVRSDAPCSLLCRDSTQPHLFRRLRSSIMDGQQCETETGALKVCLHGKCQKVGCDLVVGSGARLDQCGECGGDGACQSPGGHTRFVWSMREASGCSVSCGSGGRQEVRFMCEDSVTKQLVEPGLCHKQNKPPDSWRQCGLATCGKTERNRATQQEYYDVSESEEYDDYGEDGDGDGDSYRYDNLTHVADYLETANSANRKLNLLQSLPALLLFVFLSKTEKVF